MKFLLLAIVVAIAIWMLVRPRRLDGQRRAERDAAKPQRQDPQPMIACAHCGVHLPRDEALVDTASRRYCCEGHRALGPPR